MILIKTNLETLLKPLQMVTGIVESKQTSPILSNVLIKKEQEHISFLTTDLEIQIKSTINNEFITGEQEFSLTVSARKFQDILRSLSPDSDVTLIKKDNLLQIKSGKSAFNLQTLPIESFPKIPEDRDPEASITLQQNNFKTILQRTQFAIAQQDIRYYLNGLLLLIEDKDLICVATDGHRLAYAALQIKEPVTKKEVILPRKTILELVKQLNDSEDPVKIEFLQKKVRIYFSNLILTSKLIDGKFPDYKRAIPECSTKNFDLDRLAFLQALQRASILLHEKLRIVRLIIGENRLSITSKNNEQEETHEEIEIQYEQNKIDMSFNLIYLLDLLNNINEETIHCTFSEENGITNSLIITIPQRDDFIFVVKPMRN